MACPGTRSATSSPRFVPNGGGGDQSNAPTSRNAMGSGVRWGCRAGRTKCWPRWYACCSTRTTTCSSPTAPTGSARDAAATPPGARWSRSGTEPTGSSRATSPNAFDSLDHQVMLSTLGEKIHDSRFLRLVEGMLTAGYLEDWRWHATLSGCPQGGVASPVLSNIYLDRLDKFVETILIPEYTRGVFRKDNPEYGRVRMAAARA